MGVMTKVNKARPRAAPARLEAGQQGQPAAQLSHDGNHGTDCGQGHAHGSDIAHRSFKSGDFAQARRHKQQGKEDAAHKGQGVLQGIHERLSGG